MSFVMMQLGSFQFALDTAVYQELNRSSAWRWAEHETFGTAPISQYVGQGKESITLSGVIFPEFRGGFGQLENLRALADQGLPQTLVSGEGVILGQWCIEQIDETQATLDIFGRPRKQDFNIQLKRFS